MAALPETDPVLGFKILEINLHFAVLQTGELPTMGIDEEKEVGTRAFGNRY